MKSFSKLSIVGLIIGSFIAVGCGASPDEVTAGSESKLKDGPVFETSCRHHPRITCSVNKNQAEVNFWIQYCRTTVLPLYPTVCGRGTTIDLQTCVCNFADTFSPICVSGAYTYLSCIRGANNFVCQDSDGEGNTGLFPWIETEECLAEQDIMFGGC